MAADALAFLFSSRLLKRSQWCVVQCLSWANLPHERAQLANEACEPQAKSAGTAVLLSPVDCPYCVERATCLSCDDLPCRVDLRFWFSPPSLGARHSRLPLWFSVGGLQVKHGDRWVESLLTAGRTSARRCIGQTACSSLLRNTRSSVKLASYGPIGCLD